MTTTTNMGLTQSTVGTTTGPEWATNAENNLLTIDAHDHTSGKGVQLTPSSLNINADLEFNLNSATELKNVVLDNAVHASASGDTNNSVYEFDGNLYWRNASGGSVQITSGTAVNTTGGSISGMSGNAQVQFSSNSYAFKFDKTLPDPGIAKISHADLDLYKYDAAGSAAKVTLKFLGSGTSAALTVPDETGTLLTTATSFAGTINVATSSSNAPINLKPNGTGHVAVGNGGASGKLTSNGAYDLVLDTNSGTNSGSITITDGANGDITIDTNGTGDINLTGGADVNIPANIGLTFGDDGEKIEGDGTDLTIASSATLNVNTGSASGNDLKVNTSQLVVEGDTGNVGIGTSPSSPLHINNAASSACRLFLQNTGNTAAGYTQIWSQNNDLAFNAGNSERLRIDSSGNVGIGVTATNRLAVKSTSSSLVAGKVYHGTTFQIEDATHNAAQVVAYSEIDKSVQFAVERSKSSGSYNDMWVMGMSENSTNWRLAKDTLGTALVVNTGGTLSVGDQTGNPSNNASRGVSLAASGLINASRAGTVAYIDRSTGDGDIVIFTNAQTQVASVGVRASAYGYFEFGSTGTAIGGTSAHIWLPIVNGLRSDNTTDIGESAYRFDDIYATNGTIQTSDRNEKQDIEELSEAERRVAVVAKGLIRKFRWKSSVSEKGEDARIHFGIIAQDLQSAFEAEGLDAGRYAVFIHTEWWETQTEVPAVVAQDAVYETQIDEEGNEVQVLVSEAVEAQEAYTRTETYDTEEEAPDGAIKKDRMGIRYSELLAFIIAAI